MMTELVRSYLARKVDDPDLRATLTPEHPVGCRRPLISRTWLPTLTRPDVRLVTAPITEITGTGLRTADGELHEVDTIVYGTGFRADEYLSTIEVIGEGGRRLRDDWADGGRALPGAERGRVPEPVPAVRPQHQRRELDHLLPRGPGALRDGCPAGHAPTRDRCGRRTQTGDGPLQPAHPGGPGRHGLGGRVQQLLPGPVGQGGHPVARQRRPVLDATRIFPPWRYRMRRRRPTTPAPA